MKNLVCRIRGHRFGPVTSGRDLIPYRYDCVRCQVSAGPVLIGAQPPALVTMVQTGDYGKPLRSYAVWMPGWIQEGMKK